MRHTEEPIWSCTVGCQWCQKQLGFICPRRGCSTTLSWGCTSWVKASLLCLHPHPPLSQHWSCGSTEKEGKVEGKSNANSYWQTFWLLFCTTLSKHIFEMVKCLEDGTAGAEEAGALYVQDLIAAEWLLNPRNLNSWPRKPSCVGYCQTECAAFPSHLLKHGSSG